MQIQSFVFNAFRENTYVVSDNTKSCIIIDPGCYEPDEQITLKKYIEDHELHVEALVNTHCHIDHVLGNHFVKNNFDVPLYVHRQDVQTLQANDLVAPVYGFPRYEKSSPDKFVEAGDRIIFGQSWLEVLFVPGHAPGHIALINEDEKICISGDVLFRQGIGRTDLPGGDFDTLMDSIKNKLFNLPEDMNVFCGHGAATQIGYEKQFNPFCGQVAQQ